MSRRPFSHVVAATLFAAAGPAAGAIITPGTGTNGADTYVQNGSTSNFSAGADLVVKNTGDPAGTTNRKAYLRFDTATLPTPGTIGLATLTLGVSVNNGGGSGLPTTTPQNFIFSIFGLNDGATAGGGKLGEDWDPTTITYANAPANDITGGGSVLTGSGTTDGGQAVLLGTFNVTEFQPSGTIVTAISGTPLINFLNANTDGRATFIVTRTGFSPNTTVVGGNSSGPGNANSAFASAQATNVTLRPTLTAEVPEPGALAVAAVSGLLLLRRRARA